jgi:large subunit ribosomal protein L31
MKANIHPEYKDLEINCSCGNTFTTKSTFDGGSSMHIEVCDKCHPFYTGKQKIVDTAGRIEKFKNRFLTKPKVVKTEAAAAPRASAKPKAATAAKSKAAASASTTKKAKKSEE